MQCTVQCTGNDSCHAPCACNCVWRCRDWMITATCQNRGEKCWKELVVASLAAAAATHSVRVNVCVAAGIG
ncbi:hypothetical protein DUNSADRAFT_8426 [Dunaliella salina]|uniref:Metallothionein n=1 Tax=Dunaliella salina TaxID=3046 RepID=A0ABQ7GJK0_DUNSA|nr:hypothetical protein DUNSADRAFT_8426 [Dunaliella salina]|eukprot:KAF5834787.1 hypothetical protein DUNSADRAFT_8426 [Dunaliella salina]